MRLYKSAVFALVAFALEGSAALAQDARAVEVTPYVALGSAGASRVGMMITFPVTSTLAAETEMAYRRGGGLSSSASLLYFLPRFGQSTSYVAGRSGDLAIRCAGVRTQRSSCRHRLARGPHRECRRQPEDTIRS